MSWFKFGFGKKKKDKAEEAAPEPVEDQPGQAAIARDAPVSEAGPERAAAPDPEALADPASPPIDRPEEPVSQTDIAETVDRPGEAAEPVEPGDPEAPEGADRILTPSPDEPEPLSAASPPPRPEPGEEPAGPPAGDAEAPVEPEEPAIPAVDADAEPDAEDSATADGFSGDETPDETPDETAAPADGVSEAGDRQGFFARIASGLKKSSSRFSDSVSAVFTRRKLDDEALEELEDLLIAADLGAKAAGQVTAKLAREKFDKDVTPEEIKTALAEVVTEILKPYAQPLDMSGPSPRVVLFVGVNGSGKTTTLGKIAVKMTREGADVITAAGDTFRAAAVEQLEVWSKRANARFMSRPLGADAAGLAFDALETGKRADADAVLIDTAGRLQNKAELMDELRKIVRVLKKQDETAPHHVLLVLDGTVGSNALSQAEAFIEAANVTGVIMTKLDGTAKGGALVQVAQKFQLPIHFIGVGEGEADLTAFDARAFARALAGLKA
ncbi:MAG: signal recognition particle-docking protein FtsY [Oceanicaulis sp.]